MNLQVSCAFCITRLNGVELLSQCWEMRLCGLDREARPQARGETERIVFWLRQIVQSFGVGKHGAEMRVDSERQPDIGRNERAHTAESIGSDTDHGIRLAIDLEIAADEIVPASPPVPKSISNYYHRYVRVRPTFVGRIKTALRRLHTHEREEIF